MLFSRLFKSMFAVGGALLLTATSAGAHSGHGPNYTTTSTAVNAYPNWSLTMTVGASEANTVSIDFGPGWRFAHADSYGSEVTPNPNDGDVIGGSVQTAALVLTFCAIATQSKDLLWEDSMTGAPSGAVAHYILDGLTGDTDVWLIEENDATDDYRLDFDVDEAATCNTQPSTNSVQFGMNGTVNHGGHPSQNPAASGCYDITMVVTDTASGTHAGTTTVPIGSASC